MSKNYFTCPRCGTNLDYDPAPAPWQTFPAPQDIKTEAERIRAERDEMPEGYRISGYIKHNPMEAAQIGAEYSPVIEPIAPRQQLTDAAGNLLRLMDSMVTLGYFTTDEWRLRMDAVRNAMAKEE